MPDAWCKRKGHVDCKDRYPKEVAAYTHMSEDGWLNYRRGVTDVMVVPYNPWVLLYFTAHINVRAVTPTRPLKRAAALLSCRLHRHGTSLLARHTPPRRTLHMQLMPRVSYSTPARPPDA